MILRIICLAFLLSASSNVDSQTYSNGTQGTFEVIQDQSLKKILSDIGLEHELLLAYPNELVENIIVEPSNFNYTSVQGLLDQLLADHSIEVKKINNNRYLIRKSLYDPEEGNYHLFSGYVLDAANNDPLSYAAIYYEDYSQGVFSNEEGQFEIQGSSDNADTLIVSYLSYKPVKICFNDISKNPVIKLHYDENKIESILVEYVVPPLMIANDGMSLILSEANSPGQSIVSNDLMRQLQMLPGISAHNDDETRLKIRGSNSDQSKIILDGMPLYNLDHYYGIFGSINSDFVDEVQLYKNAQPIQYDGYGGGLLLLESINWSDKLKGNANVNLLNSSLALCAPLSDHISINLGGRTTYRNVDDGGLINLKRQNNEEVDFKDTQTHKFISNQPDFRFYDLNTRLNIKTGKKSNLSYSLFKSHDQYSNSYDLNFETMNNIIVFNESIYRNEESWNNFSNALQFSSDLKDNLSLKSNFHYTNYDQNSALNSELRQDRNGNIVRDEIANINQSSIRDYGGQIMLKAHFGSHHLTGGIDITRFEASNLLTVDDKNIINQDFRAELFSFFADYDFSIGPLNVSVANRLSKYKNGSFNPLISSPQINGLFRLDENRNIKFSLSRTHQFLREINYETRQSQSIHFFTLSKLNEIPVLTTDNIMIGYSHQLSRWSIDIEAYKKSIAGSIQLTSLMLGFQDGQGGIPLSEYKLFVGERDIAGIDFLVSYSNKKYSGWLAYSLSKSTDTYQKIYRGNSFLSEDDRRHQIKLINNFKIGQFTMSNNMVYVSGKPYLPLENLNNNPDRETLDTKDLFENLPAYIRFDLGLDYNFSIGKTNASIGVSMFNILNRQNVKYFQYSYRILSDNSSGHAQSKILGTEAELLDRTLNFNINLKF